MKLTKKEAQKIADLYNLGKVEKFELFKGGLVNYNYEIKTDKGEFIARVFGHKIDEWKKASLKREFRVLRFLKKKKFLYETPFPIKSKKGKIISKVNGKTFWVYKKITGEKSKKGDLNQFRNMAKTLGIYHQTVKELKVGKITDQDITWLYKEYAKMSKVKPKNRTDKLMKKNLSLFYDQLGKISKIRFDKNPIISHSDFHRHNLLFKEDEVIGILDFDNANAWPRAKDVANSIREACLGETKFKVKKLKIFLKEYGKVVKLTKEEKRMILPFMMQNNCITFWWVYSKMKKEASKRYGYLKNVINRNNTLIKYHENDKILKY